LHSMPKSIISDRDRVFTSALLEGAFPSRGNQTLSQFLVPPTD
jgi:hypothetical protein